MRKYSTSKIVALALTAVGGFGWSIAIFDSPSGFKFDSFTLFLGGLLVLILVDFLFGSYVVIKNGVVTHIESFLFKKTIPIQEVLAVRYQPTYGIGKEVSSLYVFNNQNSAAFTMTSIWYGEKVLRDFANDLRQANPRINFDDEAQVLMQRTEDYFDAQKIQVIPFSAGVTGVIAGILLFIKSQSSISVEFSLLSNGVASISIGMIAGFGTYTLLRRLDLSLIVGVSASLLSLGVYWISS